MTTPTNRGLKNTGYSQITTPTMNQGQMDLMNTLSSGAMSGLKGGGLDFLSQMAAGGSPEMWQKLEAPAMRQFGALQGNLASRFSGMGGSGSMKSSGFQNTMSEAGSDLAERLQAQRMSFQQDAIKQLIGLSENLLGQRTFETGLVPKKKPAWQEFLMSVAPGVAQGASGFGSMAGLMSLFPKAFGMG